MSNNDNEDLNFIPLNLDSSLAPNSSKFPLLFNVDGVSFSKTYSSMSLGFPNSNINQNLMPLNINQPTQMAPLTPYPNTIPNIDSNIPLNEYTGNFDSNKEFKGNANMGNTNMGNTNMGSTNMGNTNMGSTNIGSTNMELEFPSELEDNFLYSYNEPKVNERYLDNSVNVLDILRNFDISLDFSPSESRKNNCTENEVNEIFSLIEKDNPGILATMKAYRIPYPITKLLIKKIIKISLDNCKR